jgi:hypothetical protein
MRACARRGAVHAWVAHRTAYRACSVHHRIARRAHKSELQRSEPNDQVTWLAHRTVQCARRQQPPPTVKFGGWGYKYPNHPTFKSSKFFTFQLLTRALAFNSRHNQRDQSSPKSGITPNQIVTRESDTCVLLSSCAWIASFSHSFLQSSQL